MKMANRKARRGPLSEAQSMSAHGPFADARAVLDRPVAPIWQPEPIMHSRGQVCAEVIADLPQWFSRPDANIRYAREADAHPMIGCHVDGQPAGIISLRQHFDTTGEIYLLAVRPRWHGCGMGRALVRAAEQWCAAQELIFLSVKTLGPSHPNRNYARTRSFYAAMGFFPIEEIADLWPDNPCLIMVKPVA